METQTEKREQWYPIRVAYGSERSAARRLAAAGYGCWLPLDPGASSDQAALLVRSLLFVGPIVAGACPQPSAEMPFVRLLDPATHAPLRLDGEAMGRLRDRFTATGSLDGLFDAAVSASAPTSVPPETQSAQ